MKYLLLTFDIEEFDLPREHNIDITDEEKFKTSFNGTKRILNLLDRTNTKATFFVTAYFTKKFPKLIKKISEKHEIALHAYKHNHNYKTMESKEAYNLLKKAKLTIENITKKEIFGFRAPRMQPPSFSILNNLRIKYDSSLHPTYVPGRYNNLLKKRKPSITDGILTIPISVAPLLRLPFTFIWFRNLGLSYAKICTKLNLINSNYINIYFHPWEFVNLKKYSGKISNFIIRNTGVKIEKQLEEYILWCKKNKIKDITMQEYYNLTKTFI